MLRRLSPGGLMAIGFILLIVGAVLPMLMMLHIIGSTYLLNIIAYFSSLAGLVIGLYGVFELYQIRKKGDS